MDKFTAGAFVGVFAMFLLLMDPLSTPNHVWRGEAIERGYGLYCPESGEFAWVGGCAEQEKGEE